MDVEPAADAQLVPPERVELPQVGDRIRSRRETLGISLRELARRLHLSASLISQIERGRAIPSVATLYAITTELKLSLDELFREPGQPQEAVPGGAAAGLRVLDSEAEEGAAGDLPPRPGTPLSNGPVVLPMARKVIQLESGVRWERMTPQPDPNVDFLFVVYEPGGESCDPDALMRHLGREYGYVLSGTLQVTVGFENHLLGPGDAISFDSTIPHRLATVGDQPAEAVWIVVGRAG